MVPKGQSLTGDPPDLCCHDFKVSTYHEKYPPWIGAKFCTEIHDFQTTEPTLETH